MPVRLSRKNLDIGAALRQRVNARLVEALEKYFDRGYSGHVTVEKDGFGFRTECTLHLDPGWTLEGGRRRRRCRRPLTGPPPSGPSTWRTCCAPTSAA